VLQTYEYSGAPQHGTYGEECLTGPSQVTASMAYMPKRDQEGPRVLHQHDVPPAANVDVEKLLAQLAELAAEIAEAQVKQKDAEANLKTKTRELESERKAHKKTRWRLEADGLALESERAKFVAAHRELELQVAEHRDARAAEVELKRAEERGEALQHQLQVVRARLQQQKPEEPRPLAQAGLVIEKPRERGTT
jgi:septal ring factor EnvC (AmiA/AmiB activator)